MTNSYDRYYSTIKMSNPDTNLIKIFRLTAIQRRQKKQIANASTKFSQNGG